MPVISYQGIEIPNYGRIRTPLKLIFKQNFRPLSERFGRRNGLIFNGIFNVIGAFMEYIAKPLASPEV